MPNIHTSQISASAPTNALVGATSSVIVASNTARAGLVVTNLSSSTMYLGLGGHTAVLNSGKILPANGGVWFMDDYTYNNEAVSAIAHSANNIISIQEFTR